MTKIKICGFTDPAETVYVNGTGIYAMGMVLFCPKSKRNISLREARAIMDAADRDIKKVAVVVSPTLGQLREIEAAGFDALQVHGRLEEDVLAAARLPIIRAVQVSDAGVPVVEEDPRIVMRLYDAAEPGSGKPFDWKALAALPKKHPWALAGGLTPANVARAIALLHPDMVDVSSGVEYGDGRKGKDPEKVRAFIKAVKSEK